jgi:hypothetical protein
VVELCDGGRKQSFWVRLGWWGHTLVSDGMEMVKHNLFVLLVDLLLLT